MDGPKKVRSKCLYDADRDDVVEYIFPLNMENVKKLEDFTLHSYRGGKFTQLHFSVSKSENFIVVWVFPT
jgi:hypothetical protein